MKRSIAFAAAVRDEFPIELMLQYYSAIWERKCNVKLARNEETGEKWIEWDEEGIPPSDERVAEAVRELINRGHGQAPQMIHLEQHLKGQVNVLAAGARLDLLPAGVMSQVLGLIAKAPIAPAPTAGELPAGTGDVIDASSDDASDAAPALPASDDHDPE